MDIHLGRGKQVKNNDKVSLRFEYDALGRRMAKINAFGKAEGHTITRFLWDGDVPLHEWTYPLSERPDTVDDSEGWRSYQTPEPQTELTTWIFDEGTFVPSAKLVGDRRYSIISDYLGTPVEAYDEEGRRVWQRELDIYGRTRIERGEVGLVPFLYQGQYLDKETGLAYNRFRYYSPETGAYISQDPIRLEAGLTNLYAYVFDSSTQIDPLGLATRYNNGKYNVFFDHIVDVKHQYSSDGVQFNRANKDFIKRMNTDSAFRRDMFRRYPELNTWMKNPNMSGSPAGLTWHHHEDTRRLVLVDRADHAKNHGIYHPTGKGGRDIWGGGEDGRKGKLNGTTGCKS